MNDCKPWAWKRQLAAWNLFLALFSTLGFFRTFPHLVHNYATMSLRDNFCVTARQTCGGGSTSLWIFLFSISKFPYVLVCCLFGLLWLLYPHLCLILDVHCDPILFNIKMVTESFWIHFSSSSTKRSSCSCIGITTLPCCYTAGIAFAIRPPTV